jgi:hypothetical protein
VEEKTEQDDMVEWEKLPLHHVSLLVLFLLSLFQLAALS